MKVIVPAQTCLQCNTVMSVAVSCTGMRHEGTDNDVFLFVHALDQVLGSLEGRMGSRGEGSQQPEVQHLFERVSEPLHTLLYACCIPVLVVGTLPNNSPWRNHILGLIPKQVTTIR